MVCANDGTEWKGLRKGMLPVRPQIVRHGGDQVRETPMTERRCWFRFGHQSSFPPPPSTYSRVHAQHTDGMDKDNRDDFTFAKLSDLKMPVTFRM